MANTSGGAFTITLPGSPSANDRVVISDYGGTFDTYNLTVGRNGKQDYGTFGRLGLEPSGRDRRVGPHRRDARVENRMSRLSQFVLGAAGEVRPVL